MARVPGMSLWMDLDPADRNQNQQLRIVAVTVKPPLCESEASTQTYASGDQENEDFEMTRRPSKDLILGLALRAILLFAFALARPALQGSHVILEVLV